MVLHPTILFNMKFNYLLSIYNPPITAVPRCQTQQLKRMIASHERANFLVLLMRNGSCHMYRRVRIYRKGAFLACKYRQPRNIISSAQHI